MKKSLKVANYLSVLGSIFIIDSAQALMECPTLSKPELKQLCRWTGFKKVPFMKIEAGEVTTKEGITLVNKLGTCRELDSIRAFFTSDPHKTYPGVRTKDPLEPTNPLKGLCTYTINTFTMGKPAEKIGFEVTFPPEPEVIPPAPMKKHMIGGVDITRSPKIEEVEIRKDRLSSQPKLTDQRQLVPLPPPRALKLPGAQEAEAAEAEAAEAETAKLPPPRPPRRAIPTVQDEQVPSSRPPARTPPPVPSRQPAWENEESEATPSQPSGPNKLTMQDELAERLQRQRARAEAQ